MSEIAPCKKCVSFAVQSLDLHGRGLYVHCFNEHSSDTFDCDAPAGPFSHDSAESVRLWNDRQVTAPLERRQHVETGDCWCNPTLNYVDEDTGVQHWIHHEPI
jgi:hypothetical protein